MAKAPRKFSPYRTYPFKDRDPILDRFEAAFTDSEMTYGEIHDASGVSVGTLGNWRSKRQGGTRRPQYCTVMATFRAMGIDLKETPYSLRKNGGKT
mgnify:CR=1 FL=1